MDCWLFRCYTAVLSTEVDCLCLHESVSFTRFMYTFSPSLPLPQWLTPGMTRAGDYEKAELGKTEISLVQFSVSPSTTHNISIALESVCVCVHVCDSATIAWVCVIQLLLPGCV